jgi:quercetin dioxygenase-like cupin family protein
MTEHAADQPDAFARLGVGISHHFGGGVYAKETSIPAGVELTQHRHEFDHLSVLAAGEVELDIEGDVRRLVGPSCIVVKAGLLHKVTALTPAIWFCIHAADSDDAKRADGAPE